MHCDWARGLRTKSADGAAEANNRFMSAAKGFASEVQSFDYGQAGFG
jgi:hypothetical protein